MLSRSRVKRLESMVSRITNPAELAEFLEAANTRWGLWNLSLENTRPDMHAAARSFMINDARFYLMKIRPLEEWK